MDLVYILLRVLHIGAAILWAGGSALFFFYLEPTMNKLGPAAEPFVNEMMNVRKAPIYFFAASTVAVLGGVILYVRDAGGIQLWSGKTGIVFTIGAIAGILAWIGGNALIPPGIKRVGSVAAEMQAAGGPPSAELMAQMHAAQQRLRTIGLWDLVLIFIAIIAMESARYVG